MTEREPRPALHRSVFARLVGIMLVMAASLLAMVGGFYFVILMPRIHAARDHLVAQHVRAIAESAPSLETARAIATKLDMQIRFVGAEAGWTTDEGVLTLEEIERMPRRGGWHHFLMALFPHLRPAQMHYVAQTPNGHYIFTRPVGQTLSRAHDQMLILLLILMVGVIVATYLVLRRALRPLRLLGEGVTRLSEGQLDVEVPKQSADEFGLLTDAFNRMARRVRDMIQGREQLLRDVSHELRSPLTRMKVALEMFPQGRQKQTMAADVAEMETMVTELLELERMRGGHRVRVERLDLIAVAREIVARYSARPPGVRMRSAAATLPVDAEGDGVRTVLRNIIENALKFSLPDSQPIEVSVAALAGEAEVRIRDDGAGVAEDEVGRLFEPFFRPDPSRSKRTGGYGLGLSICRRIMEAHGGTIAVERHEGRGTTLVLRFPRPPTSTPHRTPSSS